jgi:hypothetical protein
MYFLRESGISFVDPGAGKFAPKRNRKAHSGERNIFDVIVGMYPVGYASNSAPISILRCFFSIL